MFLFAVTAAVLASSVHAQPGQGGWRDLQAGGLFGWHALGGKAPFAVEGGEIVGRSVPDSPNTFLATKETFGDFVLEFDTKVDPKLNSGVMVRGQSRPDYRDGVVHGYQVEIDPSPRAFSGGIYDEQRRGWLQPPSDSEAKRAFRPGEWNRYRVEAVGPRIRTWVNGVPVADLTDRADARGFIALQVHSVPDDPAMAGLEARFRNIRLLPRNAEIAR